MDPNPRTATPPSASTADAVFRRPAPSPLQSALLPATPLAQADDDDSDRLLQAPSQRSRLSARSISRFPVFAASETRPPPRPDSASRQPSIRIRSSTVGSARSRVASPSLDEADGRPAARHRSLSQSSLSSGPFDAISPSRNPRRLIQASLPRLTEEGVRPSMAELGIQRHLSPASDADPPDDKSGSAALPSPGRPNRLRRVSRFFVPRFGGGGSRRPSAVQSTAADLAIAHDEYSQQLVDWLDIIDPEVQTLSTLTNVQNSLFVPDLGNWVNRRPLYVLSQPDMRTQTRPVSADARLPQRPDDEPTPPQAEQTDPPALLQVRRSTTITSCLSDSHYAALPPGRTLEGWSAADKWELDDHVRHMLHLQRSRFKRSLKGFGQYVRRPLGFFVTLYATLITLFGLTWVLFLIGWIYVGEKQVYAIHVIDSVLVALFAIMGNGLAPFRAIDTYHMIFVVHYSRLMAEAAKARPPRRRLRRRRWPRLGRRADADAPPPGALEAAVAPLAQTLPRDDAGHAEDHGAEPRPALVPAWAGPENAGAEADLEDGKSGADADADDDDDDDDDLADYYPLTAKQRDSLLHHQKKLAKSHSFYKPHETFTHFSFPLGYLMAIVILLDCHSCLQISLGACTWGIDYRVRPFAITTVILCVSITCNLTAGLVIMVGDRKTRKKDVIKLLNRQELTGDAIRHIEHKRRKEVRHRDHILQQLATA